MTDEQMDDLIATHFLRMFRHNGVWWSADGRMLGKHWSVTADVSSALAVLARFTAKGWRISLFDHPSECRGFVVHLWGAQRPRRSSLVDALEQHVEHLEPAVGHEHFVAVLLAFALLDGAALTLEDALLADRL